tara:strand:- start:47 stop:457 length:411 start_codon:yes stop_codon:yes gene_type:complete
MNKSELEEDIRILEEQLARKKKLLNKSERVEEGEYYWCIDSDGDVLKYVDSYLDCDDLHYQIGNYFHTEEEALNSGLYFHMNSKYHFWIPGTGQNAPKEIPNDCERLAISSDQWCWYTTTDTPNTWFQFVYRWPKS